MEKRSGIDRFLGPCRLGGHSLPRSAHVCAFFATPDEEYEVLIPFIKEGFERGGKAFHTVDPARRADHTRRLLTAGINVDEALRNGDLDLRTWDQVHLCCGTFEAKAASGVFEQALKDAKEKGFTHTRFVSHMGWAAEKEASSHRLLDYESRANLQDLDTDATLVVCVYDLSLFGADFVLDVMRTHPLVLTGGTLYENPIYVPPIEFQRGLRQRLADLEETRHA